VIVVFYHFDDFSFGDFSGFAFGDFDFGRLLILPCLV
jgi:hypothetical protein